MILWISGLHIPETYLAALVQIACRRNNWPLDRSTLYTRVTEFLDPLDIEERPDPVLYNIITFAPLHLVKNKLNI